MSRRRCRSQLRVDGACRRQVWRRGAAVQTPGEAGRAAACGCDAADASREPYSWARVRRLLRRRALRRRARDFFMLLTLSVMGRRLSHSCLVFVPLRCDPRRAGPGVALAGPSDCAVAARTAPPFLESRVALAPGAGDLAQWRYRLRWRAEHSVQDVVLVTIAFNVPPGTDPSALAMPPRLRTTDVACNGSMATTASNCARCGRFATYRL